MFHDLAPRMAEVITGYSTRIKEGDYVVLLGPVTAAPLLEALYEAVIRRGGNPQVQLQLPGLDEFYLQNATDAQLAFVNPTHEVWVGSVDVYIHIDGPTNPKALSGIDASRLAKRQHAQRHLSALLFKRLEDPAYRYLYALWPTDAAAQEAIMGLRAYQQFVYHACALDQPDPVAYWRQVRARQERLVEWLADKSHAEVRGPGIDLSFDFGGRTWISCHGDMNFPDGEIYTGPIEDSVSGTVEFSYPSIYNGVEVDGIKLRFQEGAVVEASAAKGEPTLLSQLDLDVGARRLGEFAIGTNFGVDRYTGNTLFDEKIGGTIHLALGASIPDSKGVNQSSVHWDIVHGMQQGGEIWIDGELFYRAGEFLVG